jgi:tetratricopeptide (TPR) repeat protein
MRWWLVIILLAIAIPVARADAPQAQPHAATVEKLNQVFGQLHAAPNLADAQSAEAEIRLIWSRDNSDEAVEALAKASLALQIGDLEASGKMLDALVQAHPEFMEAWNRRATLYYVRGRFAESLADIEKVLALEPRHFGALSGKGAILRAQGKNAEAMAAMKEALAIDPYIQGLKDAIADMQKAQPEL